MATLAHIYVTAHGEWTGSNWLGEKAQIGIRLPIAAEGSLPAKGSVWTPIANGDVAIDSGTQSGTHGTLTKTWTARLGPTGSADNADGGMQIDLAEDVWTFLNTVGGFVSNQFRWTHMKIAPILADGSYGAPSAVYQLTSALVGGGSGKMLPPEVALACSFRAPVIGRRGRGRFYLPAIATDNVMETDGTVLATARTAMCTAMGTLVANLEDLSGTEEYTTVVSVLSAGSSTAVRPSTVRVGSHFDAQRRRQHQVAEVYTSTTL